MKFFIGSAGNSTHIAKRVERMIKESFNKDATVWTNADFTASRYTLESLLDFVNEYDAGIFIFSDDDQVIKNVQIKFSKSSHASHKVRDNVLFEAGLFMGKKGTSNVCIFSKPEVEKPSDLHGLTYIDYTLSDEIIREKLENWMRKIKFPLEIKTRNESDCFAYKLEEQWRNASSITFVNYAASTFTISKSLSDAYHPLYRDLYKKKVLEGVNFKFILTKPGSYADRDASKYKMSIQGKFDTREIIQKAVQVVKEDIEYFDKMRMQNPNIGNVELGLTEIALPYALLHVQYKPGYERQDFIQLDIYSPLIKDDRERRRICIHRDSSNYEFFSYNITAIWNDAVKNRVI